MCLKSVEDEDPDVEGKEETSCVACVDFPVPGVPVKTIFG